MWAHFAKAKIRTQGQPWVRSPLRHNSAAAGVAQSVKNSWLRSSKEVYLNWLELDSQSWHERLEKNPSHDIYKANMKVSAQHGKYQIYKKDIMLQYISDRSVQDGSATIKIWIKMSNLWWWIFIPEESPATEFSLKRPFTALDSSDCGQKTF